MATLTIRLDSDVERALPALTSEGRSRSEAEQLRDDPDDVAASADPSWRPSTPRC